ncbi:hypothetical protein BGZ76_004158 [Entomortierella beljakovae]|nr:hypothetical protein BGZ76_004158 [Entomortierella beljakovae]
MLPLFQLIKQYPILTTGNEYETGNTKKSDKVEQLALTPLIKYDIRVEGMACEACGSRLRQYFASRKDIEKVKVYFSEKRLEFWSRSGLGALAFTEQNIQDMIAEVDTKYTAKIIGVYSETKE